MQKVSIPGYLLPHVEKFVADRGGSVSALFAKAGIERKSFDAAQTLISEEQFYAFVKEAVAQSNEPAFGLEIGRCFSVGSFGLMSRAIMSCVDMRSAVRLIERYSTLALPLVRFSSQETDTQMLVEVSVLSRYPDLNQIILEALFTAGMGVKNLLVRKGIGPEKYSFTFAPPKYADLFAKYSTADCEFNADCNLIVLKREYLDISLVTANPIDAESTRRECEAELQKRQEAKTLVDQVSEQVRFYLDMNPSSKTIADRLNLTERTMRRKLAEESTSYRELLQKIRQETAAYYLSHTQLQIAQIALKLGYQETSNFRAAFKSWTGLSPREWRQGLEK